MTGNDAVDDLLRNKKILFAIAAALGGMLSGLIITAFPKIMDIDVLSWVVSGGLDASLIGIMVIYAQNFYQTQTFDVPSGLQRAIKTGLLMGCGGGFAAYIGMSALGNSEFGRYIGWAISGGVAGYVVSQQVPNLKPSTAITAGAIGGFLGCLLMELNFGYTAGVVITGAAIGLMVATAEVSFRKNWLDIEVFAEPLGTGLNLAKPMHQYTLTLGQRPLTVGSRHDMDIKLKPSSVTSDHAASIYVENGKAIFHELARNAKTVLSRDKPFVYDVCQIRLGGLPNNGHV